MTNEFLPSNQSQNQGATSQGAPPVITPMPVAPIPNASANQESELDRMILNAAILNGALEIMPHKLATMAIVPLQMRLVYKIGETYGYKLDQGHIKDFLATIGVGLASQAVEGFAEHMIKEFAHRWAGGWLSGVIESTAGSAIAFGSTYAIGQVARRYYASGRSLSTTQLKEVFASMLNTGRNLQSQYSGDILQRSRHTNLADLLPLAGN